MSFVNWSLSFSYSFARSLIEALLKKDSVLTYIALSTVLLLIKALISDICCYSNIRCYSTAQHRHGCVEVAKCSHSTLHLFANLSCSSLTKSFPAFHPASEIPCSNNIKCMCWFYVYAVTTVTYQEHFSPHSFPYPWLVSYCHLHPSSGRDAPAQWVTPRDLFWE